MKKGKVAFTLVELIVVITILAILATIAFLNFGNYGSIAKDSVIKTNFSNLQKAMELYFIKNGRYPDYEEINGDTFFGEKSKNQLQMISGDLKNGNKYYNYKLSDDKREYKIFTNLQETGETYEIKSKNFNTYVCKTKFGEDFYYTKNLTGDEICEKKHLKEVLNNDVFLSIIPNQEDRNYGHILSYFDGINSEDFFFERKDIKRYFLRDDGFFRNKDSILFGNSILYGRFNNIGVRDSGNEFSKKYIGFSLSLNIEKEGDYIFGVGGDDIAILSINGQSFNFPIHFSFFPIHLKSGTNSIQLKYKDTAFGKQGVFGELVGPFETGDLVRNGKAISLGEFENFLYSEGTIPYTLERSKKIVNAPKKRAEKIIWNTNHVLNNSEIIITGENKGFYCENEDYSPAYIGENGENNIYKKPNFCVKYERNNFN